MDGHVAGDYHDIVDEEMEYERPKEWELIPEYWLNICV
jgi:hypothetical protein